MFSSRLSNLQLSQKRPIEENVDLENMRDMFAALRTDPQSLMRQSMCGVSAGESDRRPAGTAHFYHYRPLIKLLKPLAVFRFACRVMSYGCGIVCQARVLYHDRAVGGMTHADASLANVCVKYVVMSPTYCPFEKAGSQGQSR